MSKQMKHIYTDINRYHYFVSVKVYVSYVCLYQSHSFCLDYYFKKPILCVRDFFKLWNRGNWRHEFHLHVQKMMKKITDYAIISLFMTHTYFKVCLIHRTCKQLNFKKILSTDPGKQKAVSVSHILLRGMSLCIFKLPPNGLNLSSGEVQRA